MERLSVTTDAELLAFVKEYLPKTAFGSRPEYNCLHDEKWFATLTRYELLEWFNYIINQFGLYFLNTSNPSFAIANKAAEV